MIRILGVRRDLLPGRAALQAIIGKQWYFAWLDRHRSMRVNTLACNSLGGLFLLMHSGARGELIYDETGRPYFKDSAIDFNITHSNDMIFCAVSFPNEGESLVQVGLDAEALTGIPEIRLCPLAKRWFSENEQAQFYESPVSSQFLRIWTRKEALVKMTGEGLRGLQSADTVTAEECCGVRFAEYRSDGVVITLCFPKGAHPPAEIEFLRLEEVEPYVLLLKKSKRKGRYLPLEHDNGN